VSLLANNFEVGLVFTRDFDVALHWPYVNCFWHKMAFKKQTIHTRVVDPKRNANRNTAMVMMRIMR